MMDWFTDSRDCYNSYMELTRDFFEGYVLPDKLFELLRDFGVKSVSVVDEYGRVDSKSVPSGVAVLNLHSVCTPPDPFVFWDFVAKDFSVQANLILNGNTYFLADFYVHIGGLLPIDFRDVGLPFGLYVPGDGLEFGMSSRLFNGYYGRRIRDYMLSRGMVCNRGDWNHLGLDSFGGEIRDFELPLAAHFYHFGGVGNLLVACLTSGGDLFTIATSYDLNGEVFYVCREKCELNHEN